jgi:hypothetical protein
MTPGQLTLGLLDDPVAIRRLLVGQLRRDGHRGRLVPEMGLCQGDARIDLAAIGNELDGYEIKSGRDDLRRLASQAEVYNLVFDRLTLVAAARHLDRAAARLPSWWGLAAVDGSAEAIETLRPALANPARDPLATVRLLWRDEAADLLQRRVGRRIRAARPVLWRHLVEVLPPDELRASICACLAARTTWRAAC